MDENSDYIVLESRRGGKATELLNDFKLKLAEHNQKWVDGMSVTQPEDSLGIKELLHFPHQIFEGSCT